MVINTQLLVKFEGLVKMCEIIEKVREYCLEVKKESNTHYSLVVDKYKVNKVANLLKDAGAVLNFTYGSFIHIDVIF